MRKRNFDELYKERPSKEELAVKIRNPFCVLVDNVRSLHNVGAIFRTADAALLEKIYLCGITGTPPKNEIRKSSLGSEEAVAWEYHRSALDVVKSLRQKGYQIIALEQTTASIDYREARLDAPICLIVGHEFDGISDELISAADIAVEIPMYGMKISLNVSVAFGIVTFDFIGRLK